MFKEIKRRREWKKIIKNTEPYSFNFPLAVLKKSLEDLLDESFDFMFIPEVELMCYEMIETISNINLMINTENENEYNMLKHRMMYMLENRLETWYI